MKILMHDRIKDYSLQKEFKQAEVIDFIEISKDKDLYQINKTGCSIRNSIRENQDIYKIKYGYIVDKVPVELSDHLHVFKKLEGNKYSLIEKPIIFAQKRKEEDLVFHSLSVNEIKERLPFDLYQIIKKDNIIEIKPVLYFFSKLENFDCQDRKLVYKIDNEKVLELYKNQIKTYLKKDTGYISDNQLLEKEDKIYQK